MTERDGLRRQLAARFGIGGVTLGPVEEEAGGAGQTRLHLRIGGEAVSGWLTCPAGPPPWPVVLVIHAHGNRHDIGAAELVAGRPAQPRPIGPDLAAAGMAALCLDLPCFGSRAGTTESAAAKAALWQGGSLAGRMLAELVAQVDWLTADPRFGRVGVYGLSMGATLGYWLAAVDLRIAALAQLCCLADIDSLIATGAHDLHGIYLTVPGLPAIARNGVIAGLVAPRPQIVCLGALDPLTPPEALAPALADLRAGYAAAPEAVEIIIDPAVGHVETPAMRDRVVGFLAGALA
jgi:hypothetical protein